MPTTARAGLIGVKSSALVTGVLLAGGTHQPKVVSPKIINMVPYL